MKEILRMTKDIIFVMMIVSCAVFVALAALYPGSAWKWHVHAMLSTLGMVIVLALAVIGAEACTEDYDHQHQDMD